MKIIKGVPDARAKDFSIMFIDVRHRSFRFVANGQLRAA
jgi:hypothetical protein